jgi:hypothetical protein
MRVLILFTTLCAAGLSSPQETGLTAASRETIEKAILEVNSQMTRAAEDRDIDRLFSFMLPNERGSIIQSGKLYAEREEAHATVKRNFQGVAGVKYHWKRQMVTVISPTIALLVCDGDAEIRTAQDPPSTIVTPFAQSVLFVLTDGRWKALHAHQSTIPR